MKKIKADTFKALLMKGDEIIEEECVAELGIYGTIFWDNEGKIIFNQDVGCIMKTKPITTNEGGIVAGFAYIDNPYSFEGSDEDFHKGTKFN